MLPTNLVAKSARAVAITLAMTLLYIAGFCSETEAQTQGARALSGVILTQQNETLPGATVIIRTASEEQRINSDAEGNFRLVVLDESLTLRVEGKNIKPLERIIGAGDATENLQVTVEYIIPPIHENVVIVSTALEPVISRIHGTPGYSIGVTGGVTFRLFGEK